MNRQPAVASLIPPFCITLCRLPCVCAQAYCMGHCASLRWVCVCVCVSWVIMKMSPEFWFWHSDSPQNTHIFHTALISLSLTHTRTLKELNSLILVTDKNLSTKSFTSSQQRSPFHTEPRHQTRELEILIYQYIIYYCANAGFFSVDINSPCLECTHTILWFVTQLVFESVLV